MMEMLETTNGTRTVTASVVLDLFPEDSSSSLHNVTSSQEAGRGSGLSDGHTEDNVFENPFDNPPIRITFILLYALVFTMCFFGNIVVLIVFAYSKRMRTRTNLFLANLAVADFCVGVFCVLPSLSIRLSPFWHLGR